MRTKDTGEGFPAVKRYPRELAAVIVQKTGRQTDTSPGGHVGEGRVVIRTVEILYFPGADQSMLHRLERRRRAAAHHQGAPVKILLPDEILFRQRIGFVRDQIDAAFKQVMHRDAGDLSRLFPQGKEDINFILQESLDAVFVLEYGRDLHVRVGFPEQAHGLRQEKDRLSHHQADGDAVPVFRAEVLPLLNGAF